MPGQDNPGFINIVTNRFLQRSTLDKGLSIFTNNYFDLFGTLCFCRISKRCQVNNV